MLTLLRFLVQDDPKQSPASTALIDKAGQGEVILHLDSRIIFEAIYILTGHYKHGRAEVANVFLALIQNAGIVTQDCDTAVDALQRFALYNVDYADAWLAARSAHLRHPVVSFDRHFDKFKDIKRLEPTV